MRVGRFAGFVLLLLPVFIVPSLTQAHALEENGVIELVFSENAPVIDGRWTSQDEWLDATVTEMSKEDFLVYLLTKHDRDYVYFMFDAVTDQTKYGSTGGGAHIAQLSFDTDNDGGDLDSNDIWLPYGIVYDEQGKDVTGTGTADVVNRVNIGSPESGQSYGVIEGFEPRGFDYEFSVSSRNSPYEPGRDHYVHEFRVPISFLHKQDAYGFSAGYSFGAYLTGGDPLKSVRWPSGVDALTPSDFGSLISPTNSITAPPVPVMSVSEKSVAFGNVAVSEKSSSKTVTISNRGTSDLKIATVRAAGEFSISGVSTPATVAPGESVNIDVVFAPLSLGTKLGTLGILSNDLTSPTYTISLEGEGVEKAEILAGGGCLIATAAYGSEFAPQVQMLREIRDNQLLKTSSGSAFMSAFNSVYYSFSPTVAEWERQNPVFKEFVKATITPLVSTLSLLTYVSMDSEGEALAYGIGVILLNIGIYFVGPAFAVMMIRSRRRKGTASQ